MMKMHQYTKKSKLCFDGITLLLLIFFLTILRMIFFLTIIATIIAAIRYKDKYSNQCALHSSGVLICFLYFSDEDDCWSSTLHSL